MSDITRSLTLSGSLAGQRLAGSVKRDGSGETNAQVTLPAGVAASLTTRTDNDTGAITLPAGHGLTSGTFDVFWDAAAGGPGVHRGMTGTVTVNALAIDAGAGDNLPPLNSAVVVSKQVVEDLDSTAATIVLAAVAQQRRASVQFQQSDGTPVKSLDLGRYGYDAEPWLWASQTDVSTPFGADVGKVALSNGSSAGSNVVTIGLLRS